MARQTFQASYVVRRHNTYFAELYVPKDVRHIIGKVKFFKSTKTGDRKIAEDRAAAMVLNWKAEIAAARNNADDKIIHSALGLNTALKDPNKSASLREFVKELIEVEANKLRDQNTHELIVDMFQNVALGKEKPLNTLIQSWREYQTKRQLKEKTLDQQERDITYIVETFPTASLLTPKLIEHWTKTISAEENKTASSINRIIKSGSSFFFFLQFIGEIPKSTTNPFKVPEEFKISKKPNSKAINKQESWLPFSPDDVVKLYNCAIQKADQPLADLIMIGAHTGARIEEICSIKRTDVDLKSHAITISDSKSEAGKRIVPIHPFIKGLIAKLVKSSSDEYLLEKLPKNKYGDRSNSIGKRFGRLKKKEGFSDQHVFHSIRKTFTTMLENAGINENIAADIVGHEKPNITYGLYSGGTTLDVKRKAIVKVKYNFETQ